MNFEVNIHIHIQQFCSHIQHSHSNPHETVALQNIYVVNFEVVQERLSIFKWNLKHSFRSANEVSVGDEVLVQGNDKLNPTKIKSVSSRFIEQGDYDCLLQHTYVVWWEVMFSQVCVCSQERGYPSLWSQVLSRCLGERRGGSTPAHWALVIGTFSTERYPSPGPGWGRGYPCPSSLLPSPPLARTSKRVPPPPPSSRTHHRRN